MDVIIELGPHKLSLHTTIDHHEPSMSSSHYTTSVNCCKNILLQRQQNYAFLNGWYQKLLGCICSNIWIYYVIDFGLEQGLGV